MTDIETYHRVHGNPRAFTAKNRQRSTRRNGTWSLTVNILLFCVLAVCVGLYFAHNHSAYVGLGR